MAAPQNRNHAVHRAVVDLVHEYIAGEGIPSRHFPRPTRLVDLTDELHPDVDAAGLAITVSGKLRYRLSEDLDLAVGIANLVGSPVGVVVQWRADRPVDESYAVMRLRDLATLIRTAMPSTKTIP